jgi:hypothetical protein
MVDCKPQLQRMIKLWQKHSAAKSHCSWEATKLLANEFSLFHPSAEKMGKKCVGNVKTFPLNINKQFNINFPSRRPQNQTKDWLYWLISQNSEISLIIQTSHTNRVIGLVLNLFFEVIR